MWKYSLSQRKQMKLLGKMKNENLKFVVRTFTQHHILLSAVLYLQEMCGRRNKKSKTLSI